MPIYSKDHYDSEVKALEADLEACRLDIVAAEQRVVDLKTDLTKKESALRAAKFLRDYHFQPKEVGAVVDGRAIEVKTTRRRPHKMEDYVPHVVAYLEREGSSHYKKIVSHLSEVMQQDMGDHQVYKALRRIIDSHLAPIQMDPKHKGFFMMFQGDTGTPSVGQSQEPARASIVSPSNGERELSGLKG